MDNNDNNKTYKIIFVRHGESEWNKLNKFTGWTDVDLSYTGKLILINCIKIGVLEALDAGKRLKEGGFSSFDICYLSVLKRAVKTWNNIADVIDLHNIPVEKNWRLNERHYGALQGNIRFIYSFFIILFN